MLVPAGALISKSSAAGCSTPPHSPRVGGERRAQRRAAGAAAGSGRSGGSATPAGGELHTVERALGQPDGGRGAQTPAVGWSTLVSPPPLAPPPSPVSPSERRCDGIGGATEPPRGEAVVEAPACAHADAVTSAE
jgi:hypothetical protein